MCYAKPGPRCASSIMGTMARADEKISALEEEREGIINSISDFYRTSIPASERRAKVAKLESRLEVIDAEQRTEEGILRYAQREYWETSRGQSELESSILTLELEGRFREAEAVSKQKEAAADRREARMAAYHRKYDNKKAPKSSHDNEPRGAAPKNEPKPVEEAAAFDPKRVDNEVTVEGQKFYRRRDGVYPDTPYAIRIQANRELSPDEVKRLAGLTGYAYRSTVAGERLGDPVQDQPNSFVVYADITKSARDDLGLALSDFEDQLPDITREGTPVRTTDRKGPGTKGTRLVDGLGDDLDVEIYYDSVYQR